MAVEMTIPMVTFKRRSIPEGETDYTWVAETSEDIFKDRRVVVFAVPGAFTPTCSNNHLPGFEAKYDEIIEEDVDEVYCLSVNDGYVMNAWFDSIGITKVKSLADGNGEFSRHMGMLVRKEHVNFGHRSHRYSMVVDNGRIEMIFCEDGKYDNHQGDPFIVSDATTMLSYLQDIRDLRREQIESMQVDG